MHPREPNGFQQSHGSHAGGVTGVHGFVEAHPQCDCAARLYTSAVGSSMVLSRVTNRSVDQVTIAETAARFRLVQ